MTTSHLVLATSVSYLIDAGETVSGASYAKREYCSSCLTVGGIQCCVVCMVCMWCVYSAIVHPVFSGMIAMVVVTCDLPYDEIGFALGNSLTARLR